MKWLNHFTTDVYNAIDPYLFITPVYAVGSFSLVSLSAFRALFPLSCWRKVTFLLRAPQLISRENKFNMCRGTRAPRFPFARSANMGNFICELARPAEIAYPMI